MVDLKTQDQEWSKEPFIRRVAQAAVKVATEVMAESPKTKGHVERTKLAQKVLWEPVETARTMARAVITACENHHDDDELLAAVQGVWNAYAGYTQPKGWRG
jgi:DNA-binding transcriptional regulator YdaS (Cro superfamily)